MQPTVRSASAAADADAARSHDEAQEDEDDAGEECTLEDGHDADDDENGSGDAEKSDHHFIPRC